MAENRYGLDAGYFKKKLGQVVWGIDNYTPEELARELARLAVTAENEAALHEMQRMKGEADAHSTILANNR
jgi:hypothetical protein